MGERFCFVHQTIRRDDAVDDAESQRFVRVDFIAREHRRERAAMTDGASESLRAAVSWNDAELGFGETETRVSRRDAQVAREREFAPAARRRALNSRDDRRAAHLNPVADLLPALGLSARARFVQ